MGAFLVPIVIRIVVAVAFIAMQKALQLYTNVERRVPDFVEDIDTITTAQVPKTLEQRKDAITTQIQRGSHFLQQRYPGCAMSIYFQAFTSTYDSVENLKQLYDLALSGGTYKEFIVSTRPDCLSLEVVQLLASYKDQVETVWVELGLQSGNDETLRWIGRGHTVDDCCRASELLHTAGIAVSSHIILGFPQEQEQHIYNTAKVLTQTHPEAIKIHNLHVVAGTRLYDRYIAQPFPITTRAEHVANTITLLRRIPDDMVIQRFISDTPAHRLAAPRDFGDKNQFIRDLMREMDRLDVRQGDLV